ncbi:CLUMA_CG002355, isoform A [Clunio marinus]|uniref:CLUMA_CG002355, isoform A n=1 Tax=Clunio marinus TaxID=568069 RepID=A0A1J1HMA1_9DIPT|nr:CLUMA_CG002355, isoform A [Clunio marinus]
MEFLKIKDKNGLRVVTISNPKKKNALSRIIYNAFADVLNTAAKDDNIKCVVITGEGDFYSSGNDITQSYELPADGSSLYKPLDDMVKAYVRFPKLLIAVVNGPAIGIAATTVALCDIIYAHDSAYFYTPFTNLGLCAEGCSSLTFPQILGTSKAIELLSLNHKMSAQEAHAFGFVASVYNDEKEIWNKIQKIGDLPIGSIMSNKKLTRRFKIEELEEANDREIKELEVRQTSEEALMAILKFQESRKPKNKL